MASHSAAMPTLVSWQQKRTLETLFSLFLFRLYSVSSLSFLPSFYVPTPLGLGCSPCQGMTPPLCFYRDNARPLKSLFECKFGELGKVTQGFHLRQLVLCQFRNFFKGRGQLCTLCGQRHCETSISNRQ